MWNAKSALRKANAEPIHYIWERYFGHNFIPPKDFATCLPQFLNVIHLFEYHPPDKSLMKKLISQAKNTNDLTQALPELYGIGNPIKMEYLRFYGQAIQFPSLSKATNEFLFASLFRNFLQITYQLKEIILSAMDGNNDSLAILQEWQNMMVFFAHFNGVEFQNFKVILPLFLEIVQFYWESMLTSTEIESIPLCCIRLIIGLVNVTMTELSPQNGNNSVAINFILCQLYKFFGLITANQVTRDAGNLIKGTLTILLTIVKQLTKEQRKELSCAAIHLLNNVLHFDRLPNVDIYQIGSNCLKLYGDCSEILSNKLTSYHFDVIIRFVSWAISTFSDTYFSEDTTLPEKLVLESLGTIIPTIYFESAIKLKPLSTLNFNEHINFMALKLNDICTQYKSAPFIISLLIAELKKETKFSDDQYRTYVAFIIKIMGNANEASVISGINNDWPFLLTPTIFPPDPFSMTDRLLRDSIIALLYRLYKADDKSQMIILDVIGSYLDQIESEQAIYHFLPLFNQLLYDKIDFVDKMRQSTILKYILRISAHDLVFFDFLRICVYLEPDNAYANSAVLNSICESFYDNMKRQSAITCLACGLSISSRGTNKSQDIQRNVISGINAILVTSLENRIEDVIELFPLIASCITSLDPDIIEYMINSKMFENLARIAVDFQNETAFMNVIELFISIAQQNYDLMKLITSPDRMFYSVLEKACKEELLPVKSSKLLMDFVLCTRKKTQGIVTIKNSKAVELLLMFAKSHKECEKEILDFLLKLSGNIANLYNLHTANVVEYILDIIPTLNEDNESRNIYLQLFKSISRHMFTTSTFYKVLSVIKSKDYKQPGEILTILNDLLEEVQTKPPPSSFYHFDGKGTGIFNIPVPGPLDTFTFAATIRLDNATHSSMMPLFSLIVSQNERLIFHIKEGKIHMFRKDVLEPKPSDTEFFDYDFKTGEWYFITISMSKTSFVLSIDGQTRVFIPQIFTFSGPITACIASRAADPGLWGFSGDISSAFFFRLPEITESKELIPNQLPENLQSNLIFYITPSDILGKQNAIYHNEIIPVSFRGTAVPFLSRIIDVIPSVGAISNFLPLFQRMFCCDRCKELMEYCDLCGSLSIEDGKTVLNLLFHIMGRVMTMSEQLQQSFESIHGFDLLSSFLCAVDPMYFDDFDICELLYLFESFKGNPRIAQQMVISIWLNFDLITHFSQELQQVYFSSSIVLAYQTDPTAFKVLPSYDFLIYRAVQHFSDESKVSTLAWKFISKLLLETTNISNLETIVYLPLININDFSSIIAFQFIIKLLETANPAPFIKILNKFGYFLPFVMKMQSSNVEVQKLCVQILHKIFLLTNRSLVNSVFQICIINNYSTASELIPEVKTTIFNEFHIIKYVEFFPFYVKLILTLDKEEIRRYEKEIVDSFNINTDSIDNFLSLNFWYYWLFQLSIRNYDESTELYSFTLPYSLLLQRSLMKGNRNAIGEFFTFLDSYSISHNVNFHKIKNTLLIYLFRPDQEFVEALFPLVFDILFFQHKHIEAPQYVSHINDSSLSCMVIQRLPPQPKYFFDAPNEGIPSFVKETFEWFDIRPNYDTTFHMKIDDEGNWEDEIIATKLVSSCEGVSLMPVQELVKRTIVPSVVALAYIEGQLLRVGKQAKLAKFPKFLPTVDDYSFIAASIITRLCQITNTPSPPLDKYLEYYKDDMDSPSLQLFLFEETLSSQCNEISEALNEEITKFQNNFITYLLGNLGIEESYHEQETLIDSLFLNSSAAKKYQLIMSNCELFFSQQSMNYSNDREQRKKLMLSFLEELSFGTGPWCDPEREPKFKAWNYISKTGKRVILAINHHFDPLIEASRKTRSNKEKIEKKEQLERFKSIVINKTNANQAHFSSKVQLITLVREYSGVFYIKNDEIVFDGSHDSKAKRIRIPFSKLEYILNRRIYHEEKACEIFTTTYKSYLFVFAEGQRAVFYQALNSHSIPVNSNPKLDFFASLRNATNTFYQNCDSSELIKRINLADKWKKRNISNYEYLYYLNLLSGRSYNDINQYPIYPWILFEMNNNSINIEDPAVYRKLSTPVSATTSELLNHRIENYKELEGDEMQCLYHILFSNAAFVDNYLIRLEPFTSWHVQLFSGTFDNGDRMFVSFPRLVNHVFTHDDFGMELIPECYTLPQYLNNINGYDLGEYHSTDSPDELCQVGDVILPNWASSSHVFSSIMRVALNGEHVSRHLNEWIDLMFGPYRKSYDHFNLFHPYSYPECKIETEDQKKFLKDFCQNFGVYPGQLFASEHPKRDSLEPAVRYQKLSMPEFNLIRMKKCIAFVEPTVLIDMRDRNRIVHKDMKIGTYGSMFGVSRSLGLVVFGTKCDNFVTIYDIENETTKIASHDSSIITCASIIGSNFLITGGSDSSLRVWKLPKIELLSISTFHCDSIISVGGCAELGLIVSIDRQYCVIFETFFGEKTIRSFKIDKQKQAPMIVVFKSGLVAIALATKVLIYDSIGTKISEIEIDGIVVETDKLTDSSTREFLLVSAEPGAIIVIDMVKLELIITLNVNLQRPMFCGLKNTRSVYVGNQTFSHIDFSDAVSSIYTRK